jgi:hypothetical protein
MCRIFVAGFVALATALATHQAALAFPAAAQTDLTGASAAETPCAEAPGTRPMCVASSFPVGPPRCHVVCRRSRIPSWGQCYRVCSAPIRLR